MNSTSTGLNSPRAVWGLILLQLLGASFQAAAQERSDAEAPLGTSSITQVVLLGTGTPTAHPDRSGPSVAIVVRDTPYIVDAGPGLVRRASGAYLRGIRGLSVNRLGIAFLTHLHSDHTVGLPDLIFTPWVVGRRTPLELYGPTGVKSMAEHLLIAYEQDIKIRTEGTEHKDATGYRVNAHEIKPGIVYRDENVIVTAFLVNHGDWPEAYGYKFQTPDRTIVISGDTAVSENLIENARGCDILIHEVYSREALMRMPPSMSEYHGPFHTSTKELAAIASEVRPRLLVLYHQLMFGATPAGMVAEIEADYDGLVVYGNDFDVY